MARRTQRRGAQRKQATITARRQPARRRRGTATERSEALEEQVAAIAKVVRATLRQRAREVVHRMLVRKGIALGRESARE
jgi:hypothetical protein